MELEATTLAFVNEPLPIALADISASGAFQARKSGIDIDDGLALAFSLVLDESLKLAKGPISELPVEASSEPLISLNSELLQCHGVEGLEQYPVGDLVVGIGHEAFFPSRELLELSLGRTGAFGLKPPTEILILSLDHSNVRGVVKFIIGEDGMVDYAGIDPENGGRWPDGGRSFLNYNAENEFVAIIGELCTYNLPTHVFPEIFRDFNLDSDSLIDTCKGREALSEFRCECSLIVSDGRPFFLLWKSFQFSQLEHLRGIVPSGCNDRCRDLWIFFPDRIIGEMMELEFIDDFIIETNFEDIISSEIGLLDGPYQPLLRFDMQCNCSLHISSLVK